MSFKIQNKVQALTLRQNELECELEHIRAALKEAQEQCTHEHTRRGRVTKVLYCIICDKELE